MNVVFITSYKNYFPGVVIRNHLPPAGPGHPQPDSGKSYVTLPMVFVTISYKEHQLVIKKAALAMAGRGRRQEHGQARSGNK